MARVTQKTTRFLNLAQNVGASVGRKQEGALIAQQPTIRFEEAGGNGVSNSLHCTGNVSRVKQLLRCPTRLRRSMRGDLRSDQRRLAVEDVDLAVVGDG